MALVIFNLSVSGTGSVGAEVWVNLGLIPSGSAIWIGSLSCTAISKTLTFELRPNLATKSTDTLTTTSLSSSLAARTGVTTIQDLYRKGRLHTVTIVGTGTERWWLRVRGKGATASDFLYKISYALE